MKKKYRKIGRDALSGEFIPVAVARRRRRTAIVCRFKINKRRK